MLAVNHILESVREEEPFAQPARILWIDRRRDLITLMTLSEPYKAPWSTSLRDIESMVRSGKLRIVSMRMPAFMLQSDEELSEAAKAKRTECWNLIRPILEGRHSDRIYYPGTLGEIVYAYAKEAGKAPKTIFRHLYRYWALGMTPNAFIGRYLNSGARGTQREFTNGKKPGRPPIYLGERAVETAKLLTDDDKAFIKIGYSLYKDNKVKYISDAYIKTLNKFYRAELAAPDGSDIGRPLKLLEHLPTENQFRYWGKKAFDDVTIRRGRKGERKWAMDDRAIVGTAHQGVRGPCHRFEIDATIADIYLVSRFNRRWIIGRPVVYVVVDVFSRMIVGVHVGLEGPSWNIARLALFNAFTDKVEYCASLGITISPEEWPCEHLPQEVVADRGEMLSDGAESLVNGLHVTLDILPPFRADWKGTVESSFRTLNNLTQIHWTAGAVRSREKERGERDYRLDATLDLEEFTRILVKAVLHRNHHSRDPDRLSKVMIQQDVDPTPISIWNWAADQGLMETNVRTKEEVYLHLLPRAKGSVRPGGIYFNGMYYSNMLDPMGTRSAQVRATGRESIEVWHEPLADHIWIKNFHGAFVRCPLRASETRFQGKRMEEVVDMLEITSTVSPESKYADLNSRVELDEFIESTVATAKAEKAQSMAPASKSESLKDIRANRRMERDANRVLALAGAPTALTKKSVDALSVKSSTTSHDYAGERSAEVISLLSRVGRNGVKK